jgi:hypothetical protein
MPVIVSRAPDQFSDAALAEGLGGTTTIRSERGRDYHCRAAGGKLFVWLAPHESEVLDNSEAPSGVS